MTAICYYYLLVSICMDQYPFTHGIIIQTEITCKKIHCYMCDTACRWFIVKKAKIF